MIANASIREEMFQHPKPLTVRESDCGGFWVIESVRVMNSRSRNGGEYKPQARKDIAELCNRLRTSMEHTNSQTERKYVDRIGQLRNGREITEGVEADWWVNRGHPNAQQIVNDAKQCPENIMLSIQIPPSGWVGEDTRGESSNGGYVVERVTQMDDCSVVADGGTTNALNESLQIKPQTEHEDLTMADAAVITEAASTAAKDAIKEAEANRKIDEKIRNLETANAKLADENKALKESIAQFEAEKKQLERVSAIIAEAKELKLDITQDQATRWAGLSEADCTSEIKERVALLSNTPTDDSPGKVIGPRDGGSNNSKDKDPEYSWLD